MSNPIDVEWFRRKMEAAGMGQNELGRAVGLQKEKLSHIFGGRRKLRMDEAKAIAMRLAVPLDELIMKAGDAIDDPQHTARVLITATVNEGGYIHNLEGQRLLPLSLVDGTRNSVTLTPNDTIVAAEIRAQTGPLAALDSAMVLFHPLRGIEDAATGSLAVCRDHGGNRVAARIIRVRKTGEAQIVTLAGKTEQFELAAATPILAILP